MEYFDVYNKFGEKTGEIISRNEAHEKGICHRVIHLWILNSKNQILIQQRSAEKDSGANLWYVSVGGHIESGETIESTLIRETKEELGLDISNLMGEVSYLYTFKDIFTDKESGLIENEFFDAFMLKADFALDEIIMQKEEVQAVKYINYDKFKKIIEERDESFWQNEIGFKMLICAMDSMV